MMGPDAPSKAAVCKWFARFKNGDFDLEDKDRSGRPSIVDKETVLVAARSNPGTSVMELSVIKSTPPTTVWRTLTGSKLRPKKPITVPHALTATQLRARVDICSSNLLRCRDRSFLHSIIAQDEQWVTYDNPDHKLFWLPAEEEPPERAVRDLHSHKTMTSFWFCSSGPVFWELLPKGTTVTSALLATELEEVSRRLRSVCLGQREKIILFDNARPHRAKLTRDALERLRFEELPHPPYSPDISPCDYHFSGRYNIVVRDSSSRKKTRSNRWSRNGSPPSPRTSGREEFRNWRNDGY